MTKQLFIIAGANGSGKSTLASELLPEENLEFLNADDIAKEICPENIESVKISAGKEVYKRLNLFFENNVSFAIETTLSGSNYIKTINKAKELNYNVALIYTFLKKLVLSVYVLELERAGIMCRMKMLFVGIIEAKRICGLNIKI